MTATDINSETIAERLRTCLPSIASALTRNVLIADLALDSMDTVEFLCVIHEEFGVRLSEEEFQPQRTLGDLCVAIAEKSKAAR